MAEKRTPAKTDKTPDKSDVSVARIATIAAGATIGSAAIAAAVMFATRKREETPTAPKKPAKKSTSDRDPPDTD